MFGRGPPKEAQGEEQPRFLSGRKVQVTVSGTPSVLLQSNASSTSVDQKRRSETDQAGTPEHTGVVRCGCGCSKQLGV